MGKKDINDMDDDDDNEEENNQDSNFNFTSKQSHFEYLAELIETFGAYCKYDTLSKQKYD